MAHREDFVTPTGRLVQGSLYVGSTKDAEGKPLIFKTGERMGQPRVNFYLAIAVPKRGETHWGSTPWGAKILEVGRKGFPNGQTNSPSFSWKITNGDSTEPNKNGTVPVNCEGFAGCWILKFSGSQVPSILTLDDQGKTQPLLEKDAIKPGDYIQIQGSVSDNESQQQPGVYLNHNYVCFRHIGERIFLGVDPDSIGFGKDDLPPGAGIANAPLSTYGLPGAGMAYVAPPIPSAPAPHPGILNPTPAAPPANVTARVRVMTPRAENTYEAYIAAGWNDTQLIQNGLMQP